MSKRGRPPHSTLSNITNASTRSPYGDAHASTGASLMESHITLLRSHNLIDETMAEQLAKPVSQRKETAEYLAQLPSYTGGYTDVQRDMPSLVTAERRRARRDREMLSFVEDYEGGRIDEWGNPVAGAGATADLPGVDPAFGIGEHEESVEDGGEDEDDISLTNLIDVDNIPSNSQSADTPHEQPIPGPSPTPTLTSVPTPSPAAPPSPSPQPSSSRPQPRQLRSKKSNFSTAPLTTTPSATDYTNVKYSALLAEIRKRKIKLGGRSRQFVIDRLVRDDKVVKQGLRSIGRRE